MRLIKIYTAILITLVFCFHRQYANFSEKRKESDEFLNYLLKNGNIRDHEDLLLLVAEAYDSLGMHEKSFYIFGKLRLERNKYSLLSHYIKSNLKINTKNFKKIEKQIRSIQDKSLKITLYLDLIRKYFKSGDILKVKDLSNKSLEILKSLNNDDFDERVFLMIDLSFTLYKIGLKTEGNKILREINDICNETNDIPLKVQLYEYIMYSYIEINDEKEAMAFATKIMELLTRSNGVMPIHNLDIIEAFIGLRMFGYACDLSERFVKIKGIKDYLKRMDTLLIKSSKFLFECNIIDKPTLIQALEFLGTNSVIYLIETGDLDRAMDIAKNTDARKNTSENIDLYYYYLGKKCLKDSLNRILKFSALNIAHKIQDMNKRIELMTEVALDFKKNDDIEMCLQILEEVSRIVNSKNLTFSQNKKDLAMIWLEAGFPDKSLNLIGKVVDKYSKSISLYNFGAYAIINYNKPLAEKAVHQFEYDSVFKGLLLSKIAGWYFIQGDKKTGIKLFKDAFDIMKKNEEEVKLKIKGFSFLDYLNYLIRDYVNAKRDGKLFYNPFQF